VKLKTSDKHLIHYLSGNLSFSATPYNDLALALGRKENEILAEVWRFAVDGLIRRLGATLWHQRSGFSANAMVVFQILPELATATGEKLARLAYISHCYLRRPTQTWPFNLYVMIHAEDRTALLSRIAEIRELVPADQWRVLESLRELKKTSLTYFSEDLYQDGGPEVKKSKNLFTEALQLIPGGVNSPVRACRAVGDDPVFIARGRGARIYDVDGNSYLDFVNSWGPLICGHAAPWMLNALTETAKKGTSFGAPTENETRLAALINRHYPSMDMIRLVNSGTEAAMSAIRLARGFTGRDKIIKFQGCYHGHVDSLLVIAGSGVTTFGLPGCPGIPAALAELTLTVPYNDVEALTAIFARHGHEVAAVIIEPVAGNMGVVLPEPGFLPTLTALTKQYGALFICDEVITGFRLHLGGAQEQFGLKPDLTILGKIIGGGLPLAAFGGRREIMERLSPTGDVYQAGTLSGNPLAVAAGLATLDYLITQSSIYGRIRAASQRFTTGLTDLARENGLLVWSNQIGSMSTLFFTGEPVRDYASALKSDTILYGAFWRGMLARGVWLPPSQFETCFTSAGFIPDDIETALDAAAETFKEMKQ
jgi:glutamate-1-semialdehyde 2,1-aminomutase